MVSLGGVFHTVPLLNYSPGVMEVILNEVFVSRTQLWLSFGLIFVDPVCRSHSSSCTGSFI